jgi:CubicO group peptidase (beta-lactamase class C family)
VLVELLRRLTGDSLEELGQELLFDPLGMSNTHMTRSDKWNRRMVPIFDEELNIMEGFPSYLVLALGGTGAGSNASDIAALCQMMLNGGGYGDSRILSPVTVQRMVERQFPWWDSPERLSASDKFGNVSKGLGWMVRGGSHYRGSDIMSPRAFFQGGTFGMRAVVDPEYDLFTVFFTSAIHNDPSASRRPITYPVSAGHHHQMHHTFGTMAFAAVTER